MDEEREPRSGIDRRTFIRRAAATGAAAAWATPVVQTIMARPAFASTASPSTCTHSTSPWIDAEGNLQPGGDGGCKQACKNADPAPTLADIDPCEAICNSACPNDCTGTDRQCINGDFCDSRNFTYTQEGSCKVATYTGSVTQDSNYPCTFEGTVVTSASQNC